MILLRHTRPAVAAGICYGSTDLDCAGGFEVDAAAILAALPLIYRIATSPLRRCQRLAEVIGAARDMPVAGRGRRAAGGGGFRQMERARVGRDRAG